ALDERFTELLDERPHGRQGSNYSVPVTPRPRFSGEREPTWTWQCLDLLAAGSVGPVTLAAPWLGGPVFSRGGPSGSALACWRRGLSAL
ncbi:hypothetical protein, partial [Streptomyces canus]|uniref:hypothetical protein n=1 Tax=Streptomyces canus TaxID=58343 RepID=UPI0033A97859